MTPDLNLDPDAEDPRVTGEYVRRLPGEGDDGDVTLVGAVHDHPASVHRAGATVEAADPDVLALELPPLAVPLYVAYAADDRTPPPFGGEMSRAVQAATTDRVVGVDGPSPGFAARLFRNVSRDPGSVGAVGSVVQSVSAATKHAVVCRLAAAVAARTDVRVEVDSPVAHDCDRDDDPAEQASDERSHVRRARSVVETFGRSDTVRVRDVTREEHMASRLGTLRREGDVVAVVGVGHLDELTDRLREAPAR